MPLERYHIWQWLDHVKDRSMPGAFASTLMSLKGVRRAHLRALRGAGCVSPSHPRDGGPLCGARLLDRKIAGLGTIHNFSGIDARTTYSVERVGSIGHHPYQCHCEARWARRIASANQPHHRRFLPVQHRLACRHVRQLRWASIPSRAVQTTTRRDRHP
jgi:hypothetical protein